MFTHISDSSKDILPSAKSFSKSTSKNTFFCKNIGEIQAHFLAKIRAKYERKYGQNSS